MLLKQKHTLVGKGLFVSVMKKLFWIKLKMVMNKKKHQRSEANFLLALKKGRYIYPHVHLVWFFSLRPSGHWKKHAVLESSEILVQRVHREHMKPFLLRKNLIYIPFGRDPQPTNVFSEVRIETLRLIPQDMMQTEYLISPLFKQK